MHVFDGGFLRCTDECEVRWIFCWVYPVNIGISFHGHDFT